MTPTTARYSAPYNNKYFASRPRRLTIIIKYRLYAPHPRHFNLLTVVISIDVVAGRKPEMSQVSHHTLAFFVYARKLHSVLETLSSIVAQYMVHIDIG